MPYQICPNCRVQSFMIPLANQQMACPECGYQIAAHEIGVADRPLPPVAASFHSALGTATLAGSQAAAGAYTPAFRGPTTLLVLHVDVGSAAKVGAMVYMVVWAVSGLVFGLFGATIVGLLLSGFSSYGRSSSIDLEGIGKFLMIYIAGMLIVGLVGAITGAIYAGVYNVAAASIGGLEIEVA